MLLSLLFGTFEVIPLQISMTLSVLGLSRFCFWAFPKSPHNPTCRKHYGPFSPHSQDIVHFGHEGLMILFFVFCLKSPRTNWMLFMLINS